MTAPDATEPTELTHEALDREATRVMRLMLAACSDYVAAPSPERFQTWRLATSTYVAAHRRWFAAAHPELDYDTIYGDSSPTSP